MNTITLNFEPCAVPPAGGYDVIYRPLGSSDVYRDGGNFSASPAVIVEGADPDGTNYEGFIRANKGDGVLCPQVPFSTYVPSGECLQYKLLATADGEIIFVDCSSGSPIPTPVVSGEEILLCSAEVPVGSYEVLEVPAACT